MVEPLTVHLDARRRENVGAEPGAAHPVTAPCGNGTLGPEIGKQDARHCSTRDGRSRGEPGHGTPGEDDSRRDDEDERDRVGIDRGPHEAREPLGERGAVVGRRSHQSDRGDLPREARERREQVGFGRRATVHDGEDGRHDGHARCPSRLRRVNIRGDNPVGRVPDTGRMRTATLHLDPAGWRCGRSRGAWDVHEHLDELLPGLDSHHQLELSGTAPASATSAVARVLHRAVARGTTVVGLTDDAVRSALPAELASHMPSDVPRSVVGDLDWDVLAVRQRRGALRPLLTELPSVSLVLVTRRPELVASAVRQMAGLRYPELEIVVGLHGVPAPEGLAEAAGSRPLVVHEFDAGEVFGTVIDQSFALASGTLVGKFDDDDHVSAEHLWDLVAAHRYSGATLVGKTTTTIYLEALDATVRRIYGARESFTHRVAGGTMLLSAEDLRAVGGWSPVPRGVDTALLGSVRAAGGTVYQPHDIGYLYMRYHDAATHTWAADLSHFLRNTREQWVGLLAHEEFGTAHLATTQGAERPRGDEGDAR